MPVFILTTLLLLSCEGKSKKIDYIYECNSFVYDGVYYNSDMLECTPDSGFREGTWVCTYSSNHLDFDLIWGEDGCLEDVIVK